MSARIDFRRQVEEYENKIPNLVLRKRNEPVYISFNFSFISENSSYNLTCNNCTADHKHHLIEQLLSLSSKDIVSLTARTNKKHGLEKLDLKDLSHKDKLKKLQLHKNFANSQRNVLAGTSFWIFRMCPNNNPYPSRIIGKMIDNVFYVLFIDYNHELYSERK